MKRKPKPIFEGAEIFTSLIYLCSISALTMYLLCRDYMLITTLIMCAVSCGMYMLFYAVRDKKLISVVVFAAQLGIFAGAYAAATAVYGRNSVPDFIYGSSETFDPLLAAVAILMFSFIAAFPTFYFSVKLPRTGFLLLPALAPLILGARTVGVIPGWLIAFITASYFVAAMGVSHAKYPSESVYVEDRGIRRQRGILIGILGAAAAVAVFVIPRSDVTKYGRYLDRAFFYNDSLYGTQSLGGFMSGSSLNTGNNRPSKNLLFYAYTEEPKNIITQTFDVYSRRGGWTISQSFSKGFANWSEEQRLLNYNKLARDLKTAAANGKLEGYSEALSALPDIPDSALSAAEMYIQIVDSSNTPVVRHPSGTFSAVITNSRDVIYRNAKDELFTERPFGRYASYALYYYGVPVPEEYARYFSGMTSEEYIELLHAAAEEGVIEQEAANAFEKDRRNAEIYYNTLLDDSITPKIKELADSITEGFTNDYDKALAIERWFGEEGFVYDMNFVPQELSAEYFLFTSKRGICSDFASASTLLLRAAGISARYTEGFTLAPEAMDAYGQYAVTAEYAHAFSSAYIAGAGRIDVDGTKYAELASAQKELQMRIFIVSISVLGVGALFVIFRKRLAELAFAIRWRLPGKNKVKRLYLRTRLLACGISGTEPKSTTTGEVKDVITRTLLLEKEASEITSAAETLFYGGKDPEADTKRLYRDYKTIRKCNRKRR